MICFVLVLSSKKVTLAFSLFEIIDFAETKKGGSCSSLLHSAVVRKLEKGFGSNSDSGSSNSRLLDYPNRIGSFVGTK
jgi:hypothetical protein